MCVSKIFTYISQLFEVSAFKLYAIEYTKDQLDKISDWMINKLPQVKAAEAEMEKKKSECEGIWEKTQEELEEIAKMEPKSISHYFVR